MPTPPKVKAKATKKPKRVMEGKKGMRAADTAITGKSNNKSTKKVAPYTYKSDSKTVEGYLSEMPDALAALASRAHALVMANGRVEAGMKWGCPHYSLSHAKRSTKRSWKHIIGGFHLQSKDGVSSVSFGIGATDAAGSKVGGTILLQADTPLDEAAITAMTQAAVEVVTAVDAAQPD